MMATMTMMMAEQVLDSLRMVGNVLEVIISPRILVKKFEEMELDSILTKLIEMTIILFLLMVDLILAR